MSRTQKNNKKMKKAKQPKNNRSTVLRILDKLFSLCIFLVVILGCMLIVRKAVVPVITMYSEAKEMVDSSEESTFKTGLPSVIYDSQGNELKKLKGEKEVRYLDYEELPEAAKLAIISVEDKKFASHRGISIEGILRSVLSLIKNRGEITMGGSTITQQLSRNIFLNFDETYSRKIKEIFIAIALEEKYTKEQILEYYLNNVNFSNGFYGIEAASQAYFRKSSTELTIAQIAYLCAIPNSPALYNPYKHPQSTMTRRDKILRNMYEDGYIDKSQYEKSLQEDIEIYPKVETQTNDYAQTYILKCAIESLMQAQGFEIRTQFNSESDEEAYDEEYEELYNLCRQSLYNNGYKIYTTIDVEMQEKLQESISSKLGETFIDKTDDGIYEVQGAAACIDNKTGKVVAIVGGREEDQEGYGLNRAYQSYRQPGSAIKPILVYAPAFQRGYTPDSVVDDSEMSGENKVSNAGDSYSGSISIRRAVEKSSNVATYRLYQSLGTEECMKYLEKLNFKGLEEEDYKYDTTCLGGFTTGTTPLEMAASYATLANDGTYRLPTCIDKILDEDDQEIVGSDSKTKSIYSTTAARMMTSVLESCVTEYGATATVCKLDTDIPVACKTGTTTNCVDGWLCGYSPYYTTAVWVGKDRYEPVDDLKGNTFPAEIWTSFMNEVHQNIQRDDNLEASFGEYIGSGQSYEPVTTEEKVTTTEEQPKMEPVDTEEPSEEPTEEPGGGNSEPEEPTQATEAPEPAEPDPEPEPEPDPEPEPAEPDPDDGGGEETPLEGHDTGVSDD